MRSKATLKLFMIMKAYLKIYKNIDLQKEKVCLQDYMLW